MRNYSPYEITILFFVFFFLSCGSSRKTERNSLNVIQTDSTKEKLLYMNGTSFSISDLAKTEFGMKFILKRYDTDKPVGSDGMHPIAETLEGELVYNKKDSAHVAVSDSSKFSKSVDAGKRTEAHEESYKHDESEDTDVFDDVKKMIYAFIAAVIVLFIIRKIRT